MTFTRALGYAKRPLLPAAGNAGSRQRLICTKFTGFDLPLGGIEVDITA